MTLRLTLSVAILLLLAPAARAGTATVGMDGDTVTVEGSDGADILALTRTAQGIAVTPGAGTGTSTAASSGCVRDPMSEVVTCPGTEDAVVRGNGGDDTLSGGPEDDVLEGGAGADDLHGGGGVDRARFTGSLPQHVSLDDVADDGGPAEGDNVHSDIEDVVTGGGDDTIVGSAAANDIASRGGDDTIDPGAGADRVRAGDGDDVIRTRDDRTDAIACGDGNDRLVSDPLDDADACERVDATPPVTGPDVRRPGIVLDAPSAIAAADMRKGIPVTLTSDEPVTVQIEIVGHSTRARVAKVGDFVLASRTAHGVDGTRSVTVVIARKRLRMIRRRALLTVRVTAADTADNLTVVARTFRVR